MKKHGGARPGAGRKVKDEKYKGPIAEAEAVCSEALKEMCLKLISLARAGDRQAAIYVVDRIIGKPKQAINVALSKDDRIEKLRTFLDDPDSESEAAGP